MHTDNDIVSTNFVERSKIFNEKRVKMPFTRRHRSTLKGQAKLPTEFIFLKDADKSDIEM